MSAEDVRDGDEHDALDADTDEREAAGGEASERSRRRSRRRHRRNALSRIAGVAIFLLALLLRPVAALITATVTGIVWFGMRRNVKIVQRKPLVWGSLIAGAALWAVIWVVQATDVVVDAPVLQSDAYLAWEFTPMQRFVDMHAVSTLVGAGVASTIAISLFIYGHYGAQKRRIARRSRHRLTEMKRGAPSAPTKVVER